MVELSKILRVAWLLLIVLAIVIFLFAIGRNAVEGETHYVDDSGNAEFTTIQEVINTSENCHIIQVGEAPYQGYFCVDIIE